jgi:hypothetical protein
MNVDLNERLIANAAKAVDLARFDDKDIACARFEFLAVYDIESAAASHELNFIVRMAVRPRTAARQRVQQKGRDFYLAMIGTNEVVRTSMKRQVFLTNAIHAACS